MPLQPRNLADRAAECAAIFELGLSSHDAIVSWADEAIAQLSQPPIELIDLFLSSVNDSGALELLERLAVGADRRSVQPALAQFR